MYEDKNLTKKDIINIIAIIKINYCDAYVGYTDYEMEKLRDCWFESLKIYPLSLVNQAVQRTIENSEYTPKLSTIIKEIRAIQEADKLTIEELWAELSDVLSQAYEVSRYLSYPQYFKWANEKLESIFANLNEEIKLFIVNRSTLIELSEMSPDSLQYERARFFRQMPILRQHYSDKLSAQKFLKLSNNQQALPQSDKSDKK